MWIQTTNLRWRAADAEDEVSDNFPCVWSRTQFAETTEPYVLEQRFYDDDTGAEKWVPVAIDWNA